MPDTIVTESPQIVVVIESDDVVKVVTVAEGPSGPAGIPGAVAQPTPPTNPQTALWLDTAEDGPVWDGNTLPIGRYRIQYNPDNDTLEFRYK